MTFLATPRRAESPRRPAGRSGRSAACAILERVEVGGGSSNLLLAEMSGGEERERNLATTLVYGVLRRRRALDLLIEKASQRPLVDIDPPVLIGARVALFQILFLTRVPRAAAVDEAVSLARAKRGRGAAAFTNAVLRTACRLIDQGLGADSLLPDEAADPALHLAEKHSFPPFLARRFLARHGREECEALLEVLNTPAPTVLRVTRRAGAVDAVAARLREEGIETTPSPCLPGALRVAGGAPQRTRVFREGQIYVQDEAAQAVALLMEGVDHPDGLLDLCAAPGGKLLMAAESLPPGVRGVASDISAARLRLLQDNASRLHAGGILRVVSDATRPAFRSTFGRVLLDAPCTGTGIIRRHPEIRWRRDEADIAAAARAQAQMLLSAADLVSPGGRLVYSVCSLEPEEGPERIAALLEARPDLSVVDARTILPATLHRLIDRNGFLATLPHRDDMDGFFAAALKRT